MEKQDKLKAKPIKETPILTGKDAIRFRENLKVAETVKIKSEERARIQTNFDAINDIAETAIHAYKKQLLTKVANLNTSGMSADSLRGKIIEIICFE